MSDTNNSVEHVETLVAEPKTVAKKLAAKKAPKAGPRPEVKKALAKVAKAPKKSPKPRSREYYLAKSSNGKFNTDGVKILTGLRKLGGGPVDRAAIKEVVGIGRDGLYSKAWLDTLKGLEASRFVTINRDAEGSRGYLHTLTASGRKALEKLEAAFKG